MDPIFDYLTDFYITNLESIGDWGWKIVKIIALFLLIRIGISILNKVTKRVLEMRGKMDERRRNTLESMLSNLLRFIFYFIFVLTVLPLFGIEIAALLAGAGVAGIAIAFGAQSLLKDFFNGFFILFEDQFGVGDFVVINNNWGQIQAISLRLTELKVWTGEIVFIPNGEITQVINYSKDNSIAVIDIEVDYSTESHEAIEIIDQVIQHLPEENENIVGEVTVLGVESLNRSTYTIRAIAECNPYTHWEAQRLAKQRIREAFNKRNIDLPLQKIVYLHENPHEKPES